MHTFSSKQDDKKKSYYGQLSFWIDVFLILGRKALGGYFFPSKILIRFDSIGNGCQVWSTNKWMPRDRLVDHLGEVPFSCHTVAKEVTLMSVSHGRRSIRTR